MECYDYRSIKANYHTHTVRCGHAVGEDHEYVEAAIQAGLKVLGFSEHTVYPNGNGFGKGSRMAPEHVEDYFTSMVRLREEYRKDIQIHIGLEVEYFPEDFEKLEEYMKDYPLEYMILGQHYYSAREDCTYVGSDFTDRKYLDAYTRNAVAAMKTGKFLYLAHPDLPLYRGTDSKEALTEAYHVICSAAKEYHMPLEINMNGLLRKQPTYPSDSFFKIAGEHGNDVIIGMDIHNPEHFGRIDLLQKCMELAERYQLHVIREMKIERK